MIFLNETELSSELSPIEEHQKLANAMMALADSTGWKLIKAKLDNELALAYNQMLAAKTGDESLKACTAYTSLKAIVDAPEASVKNSLNRIRVLELEKASEDPPPVHHRDGPGMTRPRK